MAKFAFYSQDIDPSTDPANEVPPPAILVVLKRDPIVGRYDPEAGSSQRGSVISTLGNATIQEFESNITDQRITIRDDDALSEANITSLKTMAASGEWYFTDGFDIWKVQFAKPKGFIHKRNILIAQTGQTIYDYKIELVPTWKSGEI